MFRVKLKRFRESLQIQHYEIKEKKDKTDDFFSTAFLDYVKKIESEVGEEVEEEEEDNSESLRISRSRTIRMIYDYGKSNKWDYWVTFTFNPDKVNRYDFDAVSKKMSGWLNRLHKKDSALKYLVVPEQHKDGAWHFHGLFANADSLKLTATGKYYNNSEVYNIQNFRFGFTYLICCDGSPKIISYLSKYITKDLVASTKGKKRYWASKNLDLPDVIEYNTYESFLDVLKGFEYEQIFLKEVDSYIKVNIGEIPIYSTNDTEFREK